MKFLKIFIVKVDKKFSAFFYEFRLMNEGICSCCLRFSILGWFQNAVECFMNDYLIMIKLQLGYNRVKLRYLCLQIYPKEPTLYCKQFNFIKLFLIFMSICHETLSNFFKSLDMLIKQEQEQSTSQKIDIRILMLSLIIGSDKRNKIR